MKKTIFILLAGAVLLASCSRNKEYVIYGSVSNPDLEGAKVFLVPLENAAEEYIDSVCIRNRMFEFRGIGEKMAEIRIEMSQGYGSENLLVVTEPGEAYVTIGPESSAKGTPQNDSLQVWKNLTEQYYDQLSILMRQKRNLEAMKLRDSYYSRSHQMALNVGVETALGRFLYSRFPESR